MASSVPFNWEGGTLVTSAYLPHGVHQGSIPCGPQRQLNREIRRFVVRQAADPFVGKVHRHTQASFGEEPGLDLIDGVGVVGRRPHGSVDVLDLGAVVAVPAWQG